MKGKPMSEKIIKSIRGSLEFYSNQDNWELGDDGRWFLVGDPDSFTKKADNSLYQLEKLEKMHEGCVLVDKLSLSIVWRHYVVQSPDGIIERTKPHNLWEAEMAVGKALDAKEWRSKPSFWKDRTMSSNKFEDWWAISNPQALNKMFNPSDPY